MAAMATTLTFHQHLAGLERAAGRLAYHAARADLGISVPTCPGWTVTDLLRHQSMVHRWATANVLGAGSGTDESRGDANDTAAGAGDLVDDFTDGYRALSNALVQADPDLEAMVFLNDAPAPRHFWARRQCHETTIHAVDALSAEFRRVPTSEECAIERGFALDGIDELLAGFVTRDPTGIFPASGRTIAVVPSDSDRAWTMTAEENLVTTPQAVSAPAVSGADTTFTGTAAQLYLGLWNRGDEVAETGEPGVLERWRATENVTWS